MQRLSSIVPKAVLAALLPAAPLPAVSAARAAPPMLFHHAGWQAPVQARAGELLLLAGTGLGADSTVVVWPAGAVAAGHLPATIVDAGDAPRSLVVRLPAGIEPGRAYQLQVRNAVGAASEPIAINDARPQWSSPVRTTANDESPAARREVKVIGRNLVPAAGHTATIVLEGPSHYELPVVPGAADADIGDYVARANLPALRAGHYVLAYRRGADTPLPVPGPGLDALPAGPPRSVFAPSDSESGGCRPDDDIDDQPCLERALQRAATVRGEVRIAAGRWLLLGAGGTSGIVVPEGVTLRGEGASRSTLERSGLWLRNEAGSTFMLAGHNLVTGLRFTDARRYASGDVPAAALQLGLTRGKAVVEDLQVIDNHFDRTGIAIRDNGAAVRRLDILDNTFGAWSSALELAGNRFDNAAGFMLEDLRVQRNTFVPGSYMDLRIGQGSMASELGAGLRVDFSDNIADGASTAALQEPGDARGWRAGFFWHLNGNQEQLLVSGNQLACTGDKVGDGEAIAFDENGNTYGFERMQLVRGAGDDEVVVAGPMLGEQFGVRSDPARLHAGQWLRVLAGTGLGQVRKVTAITIEPGSGRVHLRVAPAFDVIPEPGNSRVVLGRQFWQAMIVGNTIDNRQPRCLKSNRTAPKAGGIVLWAQASDSVIAGNWQSDSDGILVQNLYSEPTPACEACRTEVFANSAMEIRDNIIAGSYHEGGGRGGCSPSGIRLSLGTAPGPLRASASFGMAIHGNRISDAQAGAGRPVAVAATWYLGVEPRDWPLVLGLTVQPAASPAGDPASPSPCRVRNDSASSYLSLPREPVVRSSFAVPSRIPEP